MKNSQTKTSIFQYSMISSRIMSTSMINPKQIKIQCRNHNQAFYICITEKCQQKQIFTCSASDCKCQNEHQMCPKINVSAIVKSIQQKILPVDDLKEFVEVMFQRMIDNLSKLRQDLLQQVQNQIKYSKLFRVEKKFLQYVHFPKQTQNKIDSKDSVLLWRILSTKKQVKRQVYDGVKILLKNLQKQTKQSILKFSVQSNELIQNRKSNKFIQCSEFHQSIIQTLIGKSSIIKSIQHSRNLINYFLNKNLKNVQLLYKASDNEFKLTKYYQICGNVTSTVILCESNKGKIVGGYTPLCYDPENLTINTQLADPSGESFMFSLTNNDRFHLNDRKLAIIVRKDKQSICFGNGQIWIQNNADSNPSCQLHYNLSYKNQKYNLEDQQTYQKFNGNISPKCSLKQWQVWKVQFF